MLTRDHPLSMIFKLSRPTVRSVSISSERKSNTHSKVVSHLYNKNVKVKGVLVILECETFYEIGENMRREPWKCIGSRTVNGTKYTSVHLRAFLSRMGARICVRTLGGLAFKWRAPEVESGNFNRCYLGNGASDCETVKEFLHLFEISCAILVSLSVVRFIVDQQWGLVANLDFPHRSSINRILTVRGSILTQFHGRW